MGNQQAHAHYPRMEPTAGSIVPTLCGPTASLKHLSRFYRKFQMGDVLWSGRNSSVCACHRRGSPEKWKYVVKRVSRRRMQRLHLENALSREIMALHEFGEHKHVVDLVDVCDDDPDEVFMVFRQQKGGDLFHVIVKQGAMAEENARRLVASVAFAVQEIHERKWVHRDIKPENILCTSLDMSSCEFKLCDFGFACLQDSDAARREFVGSVGYQAPEIVMELEGASVSPAGDMWGIGCLLYVVVAGSMPFYHRDDKIIDQMIVDGFVDLSEDKVGHLSQEAQDVLARLFTYEPADRMTVRELLSHPWLRAYTAVPGVEPESEPHLEMSMSRDSSLASSLYSVDSFEESLTSRSTSSEELPDHMCVVLPPSAVPSDVPQFTRDQLERLAAEMREFVEIRDRTYHLRTYRRCWLGRDGVAYLTKTLGSERVAIAVGDQMIAAGLMRHVANDHNLKKLKLFYRFAVDESESCKREYEPRHPHSENWNSPAPVFPVV